MIAIPVSQCNEKPSPLVEFRSTLKQHLTGIMWAFRILIRRTWRVRVERWNNHRRYMIAKKCKQMLFKRYPNFPEGST